MAKLSQQPLENESNVPDDKVLEYVTEIAVFHDVIYYDLPQKSLFYANYYYFFTLSQNSDQR